MITGIGILSPMNLTRVMQALEDVRNLPQDLLFVNRTPFVPAADGEIMGRWINRVQIADVISDDARAVTYSAGKLTTETNVVPNIKHGRQFTQEQINAIAALNANPAINRSELEGLDLIGNVIPSVVQDLRLGIYQRCEALLVAMHLDAVTYNRFGMKISGNWGIPSDLKVTPLYPWTDAVNATPVDDIWTINRNGAVRYGQTYDRMTMSTAAFLLMIKTAQYINMARSNLPLYLSFSNIPQSNVPKQKEIAASVLGLKEIELYDARYWSQDESGVMTSAPYLPINKVILSATENDNNEAVQDFANGITTESRLSSMLPNTGSGTIGNFEQGVRGPIAYANVPDNMNPPTATVWGVMRGFPRRHRLQASAVLTVGTIAETIPVGEPF